MLCTVLSIASKHYQLFMVEVRDVNLFLACFSENTVKRPIWHSRKQRQDHKKQRHQA